MTERYEIRAGRSAPCELVSIVPVGWGGEAVNFICEGTHTYCKLVMDRLQGAAGKTEGRA
jgi:hypothetical protein